MADRVSEVVALLKALPRGKREELRLTYETYNDSPYFNLRVWAELDDGRWVPTRKGVSIRKAEARELALGLWQTMERLEKEEGDD
jgi:hypothetical protein